MGVNFGSMVGMGGQIPHDAVGYRHALTSPAFYERYTGYNGYNPESMPGYNTPPGPTGSP